MNELKSASQLDKLVISKKKYYCLMHKDIECLQFVFDGETTSKESIKCAEHLPLLFFKDMTKTLHERLNMWLSKRIIPASRFQYDRLVECLKIDEFNKISFILANKALSLSDCYWIKEIDSNDTWSSVNYYENDFNQDLVNLYIDSIISPDYKNLVPLTPSNTLDGYLPKAWITVGRERRLLKKSCHFDFEAYNEVIICEILNNLHINVAQVGLTEYKSKTCSSCICFCNSNIEFINANDYTDVFAKGNSNIQCFCDALYKIYGDSRMFYEMVELDFIIANRDRHWNNFGLLRNPHTLEYVAMAPIFDNGNSLWYNKQLNKVGTDDTYAMFRDCSLFDIDKKILKGKRYLDLDRVEQSLQYIKELDLYEKDRANKIYDECCRWLQFLR